MKKRVEKVGGETGTKNMNELCCIRKMAVHYADEKNVAEMRRADKFPAQNGECF